MSSFANIGLLLIFKQDSWACFLLSVFVPDKFWKLTTRQIGVCKYSLPFCWLVGALLNVSCCSWGCCLVRCNHISLFFFCYHFYYFYIFVITDNKYITKIIADQCKGTISPCVFFKSFHSFANNIWIFNPILSELYRKVCMLLSEDSVFQGHLFKHLSLSPFLDPLSKPAMYEFLGSFLTSRSSVCSSAMPLFDDPAFAIPQRVRTLRFHFTHPKKIYNCLLHFFNPLVIREH